MINYHQLTNFFSCLADDRIARNGQIGEYIMLKGTYRAVAAEFIGSMFLVVAAVAPIILFTMVFETHIGIALIANAIAVAWVLFALIEMFGSISGAHFNPVVTMAMALDKKIDWCKAGIYVPVQIAGGISGILATHLMFLGDVEYLISVSDKVRTDYKYFSEIVGTFILVFAILLLVKLKSTKIPMVVSFLVGGMVMSTYSTMFANPQVTIARMFTNTASGIRPVDGLIFIAMQIIGALLAFVVYKLIFSNLKNEGSNQSEL